MTYEKIQLKISNAVLHCYVAEVSLQYSIKKRPAILICPGGGYAMTSDREAEPIARAYMAHGYSAFVLRYTTAPIEDEYLPLAEASESMKIIRERAEEWNIISDNIAVIGFSAGGHLAASLATMWHDEGLRAKYGFEGEINKPNAAILCYPVITGGKYAHRGSFKNLVHEDDPNGEKTTYWSLENRVSDKTPPCFIWHTASDGGVPVENSLIFSSALSKAKIPFELHVFPEGVHGLSLVTSEVYATPDPYVGRWLEFSAKWLSKQW
ncbi:MAG: alpha/beta hydrolase [Ruminococcaceae bacterium]|nr:alpha/beta hydrolase [Oscillospiraceae bacterium]